jgi:hypothetical protein
MSPSKMQHRAWFITHCAQRRIPVDQTLTTIFTNRVHDQVRLMVRELDALTLDAIRLREFNRLQQEATP